MKPLPDSSKVRADFDRIAAFDSGSSGERHYDSFITSRVPDAAIDILEIGCGTGDLTIQLHRPERNVVAIDLSPLMIERARERHGKSGIRFVCGDFLELEISPNSFDCVVSAATLHHLPVDVAISRMKRALRPGGTLIIHDLRHNTSLGEHLSSIIPFVRQGLLASRLRRCAQRPAEREAWTGHAHGETYLTAGEIDNLVARQLPGGVVTQHPLWRYSIVWQGPFDG